VCVQSPDKVQFINQQKKQRFVPSHELLLFLDSVGCDIEISLLLRTMTDGLLFGRFAPLDFNRLLLKKMLRRTEALDMKARM
jgi:hypothetical protein